MRQAANDPAIDRVGWRDRDERVMVDAFER
jgi:hypothetical protein